MVLGDDGRGVEGKRAIAVDAAAFALAGAAAGAARAAKGVVLGDGAACDGESGARADKDTAAGAIAAVAGAPTVATERQVVAERAAGEVYGSAVRPPKDGEAADGDSAAPAVAADGAGAADTTECL